MKRLRERIRAITDKLAPGEWLRAADIDAQLAKPKPDRARVFVELTDMTRLRMLRRRGKPKHYEYCSGKASTEDGRHDNGTTRTKLGFLALARLKASDPAEWRRITRNGTI